jgi:excisionase family DNA binding protein
MFTENAALMSAREAAARLKVSRHTVTRHLPVVRIGGRVLVRMSDVEAKIREGRTDAA